MNLHIPKQLARSQPAGWSLILIGTLLLTWSAAQSAHAQSYRAAAGLAEYAAADAAGRITLQTNREDITGDGVPDTIRIVGRPSETHRGSYNKLSLEIQDGVERKQTCFYIGSGYAPLLRLVDWNGDQVKDLYLTVFDPFDRHLPVYSIYTRTDADGGGSRLTQLPLPQPLSVSGRLKDNYKVQVRLRNTNQTFLLDRRERSAAYEQAGYYQNGRLIRPKLLETAAEYNELLPADIDKDGISELRGLQRISGIGTDDVIAYAASVWKWRYGQWTLMRTELLSQEQL